LDSFAQIGVAGGVSVPGSFDIARKFLKMI